MLRIGTCSWKYDSWRGFLYSDEQKINYLKEYANHYNTVEIDQWFWSLFGNKVVLPKNSDVQKYKNSVPEDFLFTIKVPNSLTLTHQYRTNKSKELISNPNFLSNEVFEEFLRILKPLENQIGTLMFQFEYLNKQKMPSLNEFQSKFYDFIDLIPKDIPQISLEIRNPNYLNESYFRFLNELKISHIFLQGYYMPPINQVYDRFKDYIKQMTVIRLHGPDRKEIEKISGKNWNQIYINRDDELTLLVDIIRDLQSKNVDIYLNINNHFEGSAPLTIQKLNNLLQ